MSTTTAPTPTRQTDSANRLPTSPTDRAAAHAADPRSVSRHLTQRYILALLCTASGMVVAYFSLMNQLASSDLDAEAINVSGRQRMLSQRIALMVSEIDAAGGGATGVVSDELAENAQQRVPDLITLMRNSQRKLSQDDPVDQKLQSGVDQMVDEYLSTATTALLSDDPQQITTARQRVVAMASGDRLLGGLDDIVTAYQRRAESRQANFKQLEGWLLIAGICVLLAEVAFIFRPMVSMIRDNLAELNDRNAELRQFAYRISHDLRAPIVSSLGIVNMTTDAIQDGDVDEVPESLSHIKRSLTRVVTTVTDITSLLRSKDRNVVRDDVSVREIVETALDDLRATAGFDAIDWRLNISIDQPLRLAPEPLTRSVANLISNAIKYRDPDAESFVELTARLDGKIVEIDICDNGLGVPPEFRDRLFRMFERFHPRVAEGTGLGLYLVAQNATMVGGTVQYRPTEDGSRFTLRFPIAD